MKFDGTAFKKLEGLNVGILNFFPYFNGGIYFILYSPPSQLDRPQNNQILFPLHFLPVSRPVLSLPHLSLVNLLGCCVQLLIGGCLKPRQISFY